MGMKLQPEETLPEGLKRIAREQLDDARAHLAGEEGADAEERVHEARKCLKKTRAVIRLVRKEVGEDVYQRENVRFRDAGRVLAPVRDAEVFVATLDGLAGSPALPRDQLAPLREALQEHRAKVKQRLLEEDGAMDRVAETVAEGRGMVDSWPIDRVDAEAFRKSLEKTYRRGRKAFARAYDDPTTEHFHELRKRVKYLWYYSRFLKPAARDEIDELKDLGDEAADILGLDHDLAELLEAVDEHAAPAGELRRTLELVVAQRRLQLQRRALPLLRRIYAERPGSFAKRIASRYDAWRLELATRREIWLAPAAAQRVEELLAEKQSAEPARAERIREELRDYGIVPSELGARVVGAGAGFSGEHLGELRERGIIRVGDASGFARPEVDRPFDAGVDIGPNEASGICPIDSERALEACGWPFGFWVVLDEAPVENACVAVGWSRERQGWEARRLPVAEGDFPDTDDGEDCVRIGEWVYVFGSHYGSKEGPLERERQYVARFREAQLADGEVDLRVERTGYRLHRLINDALAGSGIDLFPLAQEARAALVGRTLIEEEDAAGDRDRRIEPGDLPINIEGVAGRPGTDTVLIGLRFPVSAEGHPLLVEIEGVDRLFAGEGLPVVRAVRELEQVGSRWVPAGIRGLAEGPDGTVEALTGNLDSTGKGSVLIEAHPEAALARSAHFRMRPGARETGAEEVDLVREFPGLMRVEGVAHDPIGRPFYVIDEEERVALRYGEREPAAS